MIVDTSAIIAVVRDELDAERYVDALARDTAPSLSAANYLEASIVVDRPREPIASRRLDDILRTLRVELVSVTPRQAQLARQAYRDFGKGSGHPAKLNFGDCFAYALAIENDEPLLFKGDDFNHTDVRVALTE